MENLGKYFKFAFKEKPLLGYGILGLILWLLISSFLAIISFTIGLYITLHRKETARALSDNKKKCSQCQMEIPLMAKKCPHCHSKLKTPASALKLSVVFFLITMMISSLFTAFNSKTEPQSSYVPPPRENLVTTVFDVPSLVGKSLTELEENLGTPDYNDEPGATYVQFNEDRTWQKTWNKSGFSLSATYNIDTREVTDLFLGSDSDASLVTFRSTSNILKVGNLETDSPDYSVEFVPLKAILGKPKSETPSGYTGAIIREK